MSTNGTGDPPPYIIPVEGKSDNVKVYHPHTPFTPPASTIVDFPVSQSQSQSQNMSERNPTNGKFVSYEDPHLGRSPGLATCVSCQQQVMTEVSYKVGAYAWLCCILFILCLLVLGCCLIPFFMKHFKDVYHSCPRCQRIIHVDKKRCC